MNVMSGFILCSTRREKCQFEVTGVVGNDGGHGSVMCTTVHTHVIFIAWVARIYTGMRDKHIIMSQERCVLVAQLSRRLFVLFLTWEKGSTGSRDSEALKGTEEKVEEKTGSYSRQEKSEDENNSSTEECTRGIQESEDGKELF